MSYKYTKKGEKIYGRIISLILDMMYWGYACGKAGGWDKVKMPPFIKPTSEIVVLAGEAKRVGLSKRIARFRKGKTHRKEGGKRDGKEVLQTKV